MFDAQLSLAAQENRGKEPSSRSMGKTHKYTLSPVPLEHHGQNNVAKTIDGSNDMPVDTAFLLMTGDTFVSPLLLNDVPMGLPIRSRSKLRADRHSSHADFVVCY